MGARTVKFGLTLPQFGVSWSEVKEIASLADEVGWDSVWVADHFLGVGSDDPLEAWTEMSAVAAITRRVELGFLVLCNSYRPPALLAKMAATLDAVSHGRLILGYGAGWFVQEYEAYGYDFPPIGTRLRKLEVLRGHCQRVGRSFDEIEISQQTIGAISLSRDEARRRTEEVHREVGFLTGAPELCPTGTPDEIISRLRESVQRGISSFVISFGRHAGAESLRLFAREVIPAFR